MVADSPTRPTMALGVAGLSETPASWDSFPLFGVAAVKSVRGKTDRQLLSVFLGRGVIRFSDVDERRANPTSKDLTQYQAVDPGDFVLNNQQAWRGSVGVSSLAGIVSPAYLVLSLHSRIHPRFGDYLFRSKVMVAEYLVCSRGVGSIQRNLYWPALKRIHLPAPPIAEQEAIVCFLDYVDRRTRRYIKAKERLIELLEEQKRAIVHQAVTGQIDVQSGQPYLTYKHSGVEWLGDMPAHWQMVRAKWLYEKVERPVRPHDEVVTCFRDGAVTLRKNRRVLGFTESLKEVGYQGVRRGDLVIHTMDAFAGASGVADSDGKTTPVYAICRPSVSGINSNYYASCVREMAKSQWILALSRGVRERSTDFRFTTFANQFFPVPPLNEQIAIVRHIEYVEKNFGAAIDNARREVELLREYRARLIADVVTGKLDIREATASLPELDPLTTDDTLGEREVGRNAGSNHTEPALQEPHS